MSEAEVKEKIQKQELEQITLPSEVIPTIPEKAVQFPKAQFAGLTLAEILGVGLGVSWRKLLTDIVQEFSNVGIVDICYRTSINNYNYIVDSNIAGEIEAIERVPFEQSKFFKEIVSAAKEAYLPWDQAIVGDGVILVVDAALIAALKGKYRKAAIGKTAVDLGLLVKNLGIRWYITQHSREIINSVGTTPKNPYPSREAAIKAIYSMKDQQLIPFLQNMKKIGYLYLDILEKLGLSGQLILDMIISGTVGAILLYKAYKSEKKKVKEYTTEVV